MQSRVYFLAPEISPQFWVPEVFMSKVNPDLWSLNLSKSMKTSKLGKNIYEQCISGYWCHDAL